MYFAWLVAKFVRARHTSYAAGSGQVLKTDELGKLWSNLAMAVAKISMRRSP